MVALQQSKIVTDGDHGVGCYRCARITPRSAPADRRTPSAATVPGVSSTAESTAAELAIIADNVGQYRSRVAGLAEAQLGGDRDDLVTAIYEAERQLRIAERTLHRAMRAAI